MATPREHLLAAGRILAVRAKHYGELARNASTQAAAAVFQKLADLTAGASAVCFDEARLLPAPSTPLSKASLGELLDEIEAAFHDQREAGASAHEVKGRCLAVVAEVRRRLGPPPPASQCPAGVSLAELAEQHADDRAQDPVRLSAEVRWLRARVAELEALLQADKPLPDPGVRAPEPHP